MNLLKFASLMTAATTNDNNLLPSFTKMQKDADANAAAEAECMDKGVETMCCLHKHSTNGFTGCAECMIKVFEDMDMDWEGDVCKQLEGDADFCGDWVACFSGDDPACAYEPCKEEIEAQSSCSEDSCPGLCEQWHLGDNVLSIM